MKTSRILFKEGRRFWMPFFPFAILLIVAGFLFSLQVDIQRAAAFDWQDGITFLPLALKDNDLGHNVPKPTSTAVITLSLTPIPSQTPGFTLTPVPSLYPTLTSIPTSTPTTAPGCPMGMVSCWMFNDGDENIFVDSAGPNDASCSSSQCPAAAEGISAGSLSFDGIDDRLVVPHHPTLAWGSWNSFSVEAWVNLDESCTNNIVFMGKPKDPDNPASWWLGCTNGANTAAFYVRDSGGTSAVVQGQKPINDGKWHHIVGVRDQQEGSLKLYLDGRLEAEQGVVYGGHFANHQALTIGSLGSEYFARVTLDEVAVYTSVMPESVIATHYYLARPYCQVCSLPVRIMPLGDSITVGSGSPSPYNGYRRPLYHDLVLLGYGIDFKGGQMNGVEDFDQDHEGHGGWHAAGHPTRSLLDHVHDWLVDNPAEIVLLHIGTNDINDGGQSAAEVSAILDEIDRFDRRITVILALIINRQTYSSVTTQYNNDLVIMAEQRISNGDKIILVDMESALTYPGDMYDLLHPNESGYAKMAQVWKQALQGFLPDCP
jgi:hypothetical protein